MSESLPLLLASLLIQVVTNLDYILLGILRSEGDTAIYVAAAVIALFVHGIGVGFHAAVFPAMVAAVGRNDHVDQLVARLAGVVMFFAIPAGVGIAVLAPEIIDAFYGPVYAGSAAPLRVLAVYIPLGIFSMFSMNLLVARGDRRAYAGILGIGALTNAVLNVILIPGYGPVGASVATVVSVAVITALGLRRAQIGFPIDRRLVGISLISSVTLTGWLMVTGGLPLLARIAAGGCTYLILGAVLLVATRPPTASERG